MDTGEQVRFTDKSEESLRLAVNAAPVLVWMSDVNGLCTYGNQHWVEFSGQPIEAALGKGWADHLHPEDLKRTSEAHSQAVNRREPFQIEHRLRRHDGQYRWILAIGVPRFDAEGSFAGYLGLGIDVTERKLAEEALQKNDERLRLAMESGKSVGWDWDVKSGRDFLFGDLQSIFGIPAEVYDGRVEDFHRYVHPEDRRRVVEAVKYAMETHRPYAAEFRIRWPDGTVRWLSAKGKFFYTQDGEPERMLGVATDISDRKAAEEALRESEERFRLAIQAGRMYAFDWNVVTDEIVRSEESKHFFGLTAEPSRLTKRELLARVHPEDRERFINSLSACTPKNPKTEISYRLLQPDGSVVWLERTGRAFFDEQGRMVRIIGMVTDVTDRKGTEEALRQRDVELSQAQRVAQVGSWHWDVKNDVVSWSEELYRIAGRDPSLKAPSYKEHPQILTPASWTRLNAAVKSALRSGESYELDLEVVRPNGATRWITARSEAVRNAEGLVVALRGTVQDLTERKQAETALHDSEERFRLAMNDIASGVYTLDLQGLVTFINPAVEKMFQWTNAELLGKNMHDLMHYKHPDGTPFLSSDCPIYQVLKNGIELREHEDTFVRRDGSFVPVICSASPLRNAGETTGIVVGIRDDTQRREAEQVIRESEQRFRLVANTAPVMIWMSGVDSLCTYGNQTWLEFTGRRLEDVLGSGWAESLHPEDLARSLGTYRQAFDRREPFQVEHRFRRHDGEYRWILDHGVPRFNADGSFAGYIGSGVDVTELKRAEEALSTVSQKLIEAHEEERTRIARDLHDDINQRLALLAIQIDELKAGEARKQIADLASDIQALSHRLHSSKLEYLGLAAAAAGFCRELSDRHGVKIDFHAENVPKELPRETSLALFRVLQEALQNAIKHSGSPRLQVSLKADTSEIELTVHDSGVGFDPQEAMKGRGLGLTSMQERLKLVGGQFVVDAKPQLGTTIHARVPLSTREKSATAVG